MQNWDAERYLNSVSAPNITLEEERRLFAIIKWEDSSEEGEDLTEEGYTEEEKQSAIDSICRSHIRFVSQMANYYCKRCPVDLEDMIGAGVVGMMTAIGKFDLAKNCKFTTYCGHWIKLEMIRYIQNSCPVVIPQGIHDGLIKIKKALNEADKEMTREELKEKLEFDENKMLKLEGAKIKTVSLQHQQRDGDETSFLEDIISDDSLTPFELLEREDLLLFLKKILSGLNSKIYEIVMSKYSDEKVRLQDLGEKYSLSPERIRQIREEEVEKLRVIFREEMVLKV